MGNPLNLFNDQLPYKIFIYSLFLKEFGKKKSNKLNLVTIESLGKERKIQGEYGVEFEGRGGHGCVCVAID
ncbi:unnamed protein product [Citrullus colocynthis]|uniref:Uncharacterized protein n=1 Tax=Citrullus colocynthis TaxID=252529 RepID=A0ABP0XTA0_9ROSI